MDASLPLTGTTPTGTTTPGTTAPGSTAPEGTAPGSAPAPVLPGGRQVRISHGDQQAWTLSVGAGLRAYDVGGVALLDGYDEQRRPDGGRGQTLVPWPNRVAGGAYVFDGVDQQLALTEPDAGNAIHGLARWVPWQLLGEAGDRVTWGLVVPPQPGWPTSLDCRVTYALGDDGLTVTTTATNVGDTACPYGTGAHPYLAAGGGLVDAASVQVPAASWYPVDDRGIPAPPRPVEGTAHDLRALQPVGERVVDTCFGDLDRDEDGRWRVVLATDAARAVLWGDEAYGWVQLFSGDTLAPAVRRRGMAVEPMTCPPDAFRSGEGLVRLEPGQGHTATWGITPG